MTQFGNVGLAGVQGYTGVATTALEWQKGEAQINKIEQEIDLLQAQHGLTDNQAENVAQMTKLAVEQAELVKQQKQESRARTQHEWDKSQSQQYENIAKAIVAKFKQENPDLTVAQAFGIDGKTLVSFINGILGGAGAALFLRGGALTKAAKKSAKSK